MGLMNLGSATTSDLKNALTNYSVDSRNTEGVSEQDETIWNNSKWAQYFGYYKKIPELKQSIDAIARWAVGAGFKADPETTVILDHIVGWGVDTFDGFIRNMLTVAKINGDSFAEIIRDDETGELINLKPLDPASINIIVDKKGMIKRYEQISKVKGNPNKKFKPEEIFHLTTNRVADEIHGTSIIEAVEDIILMINESRADTKKLMHRYVQPRFIIHLDTDDPTKITEFKGKFDKANAESENIYVPKDVVVPELMAVSPAATLNPLPWQESLINLFYQALGVPRIILGGSGEFTEATAKIVYLSYEQTVKEEQKQIEAQIWQQLGLRIELDFPASLENELLNDEKKDSGQGDMSIQPNEMTAGSGK